MSAEIASPDLPFASFVDLLFVFTREKIAQNVNTDEAAVLGQSTAFHLQTFCFELTLSSSSSLPPGAAFYGATLSRQFKTKDVKVIDLTPYDIQTSYLAESKTAGGSFSSLSVASRSKSS